MATCIAEGCSSFIAQDEEVSFGAITSCLVLILETKDKMQFAAHLVAFPDGPQKNWQELLDDCQGQLKGKKIIGGKLIGAKDFWQEDVLRKINTLYPCLQHINTSRGDMILKYNPTTKLPDIRYTKSH